MDTGLSEEQLGYWLANEDWYMSRHTRQWLDQTPPAVATDTLARIAEQAAKEPQALWYRAAATFAAGFSPSGVADPRMAARKAGLRAALMLADLGDVRAVVPLVRVWEPDPARQGKYHPRIEESLSRLLANVAPEDVPVLAPELRALAQTVWQTGGERRDLSPLLADLLKIVFRLLESSGEANSTDTLLPPVHAKPNQPNRARVLETAQSRKTLSGS